MGYSYYEIYTTSQRAFRGMGFPFGADEDAAHIIAWLELNKFNGVDILKKNINQIDQNYNGVLNINESISNIDFKKKSILIKGSGLIDFILSSIDNENKKSIIISNCFNGILFLPLLYKANKNIKYLELIYKDSDKIVNIYKIYDNKIFYETDENNMNNNEVKITLSNQNLNKTKNFSKEIINKNIIQQNLSKSITPNENHWSKISIIANRVFVPESEESRNKGAGGGDAND